jgi:hypothetical protein
MVDESSNSTLLFGGCNASAVKFITPGCTSTQYDFIGNFFGNSTPPPAGLNRAIGVAFCMLACFGDSNGCGRLMALWTAGIVGTVAALALTHRARKRISLIVEYAFQGKLPLRECVQGCP